VKHVNRLKMNNLLSENLLEIFNNMSFEDMPKIPCLSKTYNNANIKEMIYWKSIEHNKVLKSKSYLIKDAFEIQYENPGIEKVIKFLSSNPNIVISGGYPTLMYIKDDEFITYMKTNESSDIDIYITDDYNNILDSINEFLDSEFGVPEYSMRGRSVINVEVSGLSRILQLILVKNQTIGKLFNDYDFSHNKCCIHEGISYISYDAMYAKKTGITYCKYQDVDKRRAQKAVNMGFKIYNDIANIADIKVNDSIVDIDDKPKYISVILNIKDDHGNKYKHFYDENESTLIKSVKVKVADISIKYTDIKERLKVVSDWKRSYTATIYATKSNKIYKHGENHILGDLQKNACEVKKIDTSLIFSEHMSKSYNYMINKSHSVKNHEFIIVGRLSEFYGYMSVTSHDVEKLKQILSKIDNIYDTYYKTNEIKKPEKTYKNIFVCGDIGYINMIRPPPISSKCYDIYTKMFYEKYPEKWFDLTISMSIGSQNDETIETINGDMSVMHKDAVKFSLIDMKEL